MTGYGCVRLRFHRSYPHLTTSCSRSPLQHWQYSRDNLKIFHKLSKCWWCRWRNIIIRLQLNDSRNDELGCNVLAISFREVVGCILVSWLWQFVKLHLLLPKPLHALLYRFGDCAHYPARFVIFTQLALLCLFSILILSILPHVGTCKITLCVYNSSHHLVKSLFGVSVCQSRNFNMLHMFLHLLNRCLCVFNSRACYGSFSLNTFLDPFFSLFIA